MDVLTWQILTTVLMFLSNFLCFLLPAKFTWKDKDTLESPKLDIFVNLANCFSAGVFLGTFFVSLLPEVREQMVLALEDLKIETHFPVTEFVVVMGFFLSLFMEHVVIMVRSGCGGGDKDNKTRYLKAENGKRGVVTVESEDVVEGTVANGNPAVMVGRIDESDATLLLYNEENYVFHNHEHSHGHSHAHHGHSHNIDDDISGSSVRLIALLLSMGLHSIFEGLALGLQTQVIDLLNLFIGVLIHECLVSFAIGISVSKRKFSKFAMLRFAAVFALTIPLGQIGGIVLIGTGSSSRSLFSIALQAIAAGTFIHATFFEVIPEGLAGESYKFCKFLFLNVGFFVIALVTALFSHSPTGHHEMHLTNSTLVR